MITIEGNNDRPETITIDDDIPMETIIINDYMEIPNTNSIEIDNSPPSRSKAITTNPNQIRLAADRIKINIGNKSLLTS